MDKCIIRHLIPLPSVIIFSLFSPLMCLFLRGPFRKNRLDSLCMLKIILAWNCVVVVVVVVVVVDRFGGNGWW